MTTCMCLPSILLYKQQPEHYPSKSAEVYAQKIATGDNKLDLLQQLKDLMKNRNFRLILCVYFGTNGTQTLFMTILNSMLKPYDFSIVDGSTIFVTYMLTGVASAIGFSRYLDHTKEFNRVNRFLCFGAMICTVQLFFTIPSRQLWLVTANTAALGFFMVPVIKISYTYSVELTYPIVEPMSAGMLLFCSYCISTPLAMLVTELIGVYGPMLAVATLSLMSLISLVASFFIEQDLRRLKSERSFET
jgi:hypothetical protein